MEPMELNKKKSKTKELHVESFLVNNFVPSFHLEEFIDDILLGIELYRRKDLRRK